MDDVDANVFDKPRLDFVVTFDDAAAVRYHPGAKPIWLPAVDMDAIHPRRNRRAKVRRAFERAQLIHCLTRDAMPLQ